MCAQTKNGVPAEQERTSQKKTSTQRNRTRTPSTDSISDPDGNVKTQNAEIRRQAREAAENDTIRRNIEALSGSFETQAELYFGALETASRNRAAAITQETSEETENTAGDGGVRYAVRKNVTDISGKVYDKVVELSYKQFRKVSRSNRALTDFIRENLAGEK